MITKDVRKLLEKMNDPLTRAMEAGAGFCISRGHYQVGVEHVLLKLLEEGTGDIPLILNRFEVITEKLWEGLLHHLESFKTGNTGRPAFSPILLELIESAWVVASVHHNATSLRSGALLEALLGSETLASAPYMAHLEGINRETLRQDFYDLVDGSAENQIETAPYRPGRTADGAAPSGEATALDLYTIDVTGQARNGEIDPISGRDEEIRQMIDILSRRRKNNPILVGEPGVGKTAVVEGFALRVAHGDVPDNLKDVDIRGLDLGLLQAGAGVKGEFEKRIKAVIQAVREAPRPTIMFIDEAHTLIGAGGSAGTSDAANLLKPALARGELRTIAATTWSEYKKYIEKDPALARRFQMIKIDEPSIENAVRMLRGIKQKYEDYHNVVISDKAIRTAVELSARYLAGRQLPDKAVDLLDTSAARVKMTLTAKPGVIDDTERQIHYLETELVSIREDLNAGIHHDEQVVLDLEAGLEDLNASLETLHQRWKDELDLVQKIQQLRDDLEDNGADLALLEKLRDHQDALGELQDDESLVHAEVGAAVSATVVSDWTGIPVGSMQKDEASVLLELEDRLSAIVMGQNEALDAVSHTVRTAKAGMRNPDTPIAVFLFVGPSGVGKTEMALQLADHLFGGEQFLTTINMSEYLEEHTVSQLKGSPPGYVGYGEGGILTEAVRRQPYSVVLLDEVEKAHRNVMNLFYQVFDKGFMRDGEGREVDFKNTVIIMTSNLASDIITHMCLENERPTPEQIRAAIHQTLAAHFQPALLGRMKVVPFYPLDKTSMKKIVRLKLNKIGRRLHSAHKMGFDYHEDLIETIADRCTQIDTGARNIDFIIDRHVLPEASKALIAHMADDYVPTKLTLELDEQGEITFRFE